MPNLDQLFTLGLAACTILVTNLVVFSAVTALRALLRPSAPASDSSTNADQCGSQPPP
jgi:hypothetical protein